MHTQVASEFISKVKIKQATATFIAHYTHNTPVHYKQFLITHMYTMRIGYNYSPCKSLVCHSTMLVPITCLCYDNCCQALELPWSTFFYQSTSLSKPVVGSPLTQELSNNNKDE